MRKHMRLRPRLRNANCISFSFSVTKRSLRNPCSQEISRLTTQRYFPTRCHARCCVWLNAASHHGLGVPADAAWSRTPDPRKRYAATFEARRQRRVDYRNRPAAPIASRLQSWTECSERPVDAVRVGGVEGKRGRGPIGPRRSRFRT